MRIDFESKPVYGDDDQYIKTKIKIYADSVITNFHNKKIPKEKAPMMMINQTEGEDASKGTRLIHPKTVKSLAKIKKLAKYVQK